ncbi:MAG: RDD family protein [Pelagimonas sp.]|uniref:RDD family protein n=1 Tax=Pelagimonas sp. TaxID=2073170 RepID=UPI003D6C5CF1
MYSEPLSHLPDPIRQAEFYDGVAFKRGIAWFIDTAVIIAITLPLALFTIIGIFMIPVYFIVVGFLYRWFTISGGSATWGMRLMAIELRDAYGRRLNGQQAFFHTLGYSVTMSTVVLQIASIVMMLISERGQSLTDMVMGTTALNLRA